MQGGDDMAVGAKKKIIFRSLNTTVESSVTAKLKLESNVGKFRIFYSDHYKVSADHLLFIFKGRIITDDRTFKSYGIREGDTIGVLECLQASVVNLHSKEDTLEFLGDISGFANMDNPETVRILNANNSRMLAICETNRILLSMLNDRMKSSDIAAGSSQDFTQDGLSSRFQMYQTGSGPRIHPSNPQTRDQQYFSTGQTASQQTASIGTAQKDGGDVVPAAKRLRGNPKEE